MEKEEKTIENKTIGKPDFINTDYEELPPCVIKLILKDIMNEVEKLCYQEEQSDLKQYEQSTKNLSKKGEK